MSRKILVSVSLSLVLFLITVNKAFAQVNVVIPTFPTCTNPQGQTRVSYSSGVHGIPGDSSEYNGSDTVYNLTEDTITQCFCAENKSGIQTNWWKISELSIDEIEYLKALGWIYVPNGSLWGLQEAPYMAKNNSFNCGPKDRTISDRDKNRHNRGGIGGIGGEILAGYSTLGTGGEIMGLASTGNIDIILLVMGTGTLTLTSAVLLLNKKK